MTRRPSGIFDINQEEAVVVIINLSTGDDLSYVWDFGDGNTSTEAFPIHFYSEDGTYEVCLTVTSGNGECTSTFCAEVSFDGENFIVDGEVVGQGESMNGFSINVFDEDWLSVEEQVSDWADFSLFPNPANDVINLNFDNIDQQVLNLQVFDASGRMIMANNNLVVAGQTELNVQELSNGIYLLRMEIDGIAVSKRFEIIK